MNFITQNGLIRRLPGWPEEELTELLLKFKTKYFSPRCVTVEDNVRKLSDDTVALNFTGSYCGSCHVVSLLLILLSNFCLESQ